jgi:uncharacterized protein
MQKERNKAGVQISIPAILIKISREWHDGLTEDQLYERTRRYWRVSPERKRIPPQFALSVAEGEIKEVYQIDWWEDYPDMSKVVIDPTRRQQTRSKRDQEGQPRKGFVGRVTIDDKLRRALLGESIRHLPFGRGNPIAYLNCD